MVERDKVAELTLEKWHGLRGIKKPDQNKKPGWPEDRLDIYANLGKRTTLKTEDTLKDWEEYAGGREIPEWTRDGSVR